MNKILATAVVGLALAVAAPAFANSVTVGTFNNGNCYPLLCNDSGTNTGTTMDYQQVYSHSAVGALAINSITFSYASLYGGSSNVLGGSYDVFLGYTNAGVGGLSSNLASNVVSESLFASFSGGADTNPTFTITGTTFDYNPALGNLLLEIVATNQDNVANGSGNGYLESDSSGLETSRAYCIENVGCFADGTTGLVTTFNGTPLNVPEPMTLSLLGAGLVGAGALRRRRKAAKAA